MEKKQKVIFELLREEKFLTRTQISKRLEIPFSTVSKIIEKIKDDDLIVEEKIKNEKILKLK